VVPSTILRSQHSFLVDQPFRVFHGLDLRAKEGLEKRTKFSLAIEEAT
jgi:hypothetical protein